MIHLHIRGVVVLVGLEGEDVHRRQYKMKDKDKGKGEGEREGMGKDVSMGEVDEEAGGPTPDKGEGEHVRYTLKSWWGLCHSNVII